MIDRAGRAICLVSEDFATKPTESGMRAALERYLTGDEEVDALVREYARNSLLWLEQKSRRGSAS